MASSNVERLAKLEKRLAGRERTIVIETPAWLRGESLPTAAPAPPGTPEQGAPDAARCVECSAVLARYARYCHICATPVVEPAR